MKKTYFTYEEEFLLLHEILRALKQSAMHITAMGNERDGYTPLYEIQIGTAYMNFGTLVLYLNDPKNPKFKSAEGQILHLNQVQTKREEVIISKYSWDQIKDAVDLLDARGEVKKEVKGEWLELTGKTIRLTPKGLETVLLKEYQKQAQQERTERQSYKSSILTNRSIRLIGVLTFIVALGNVVVSYWQYKKPETITQDNIQKVIQALEKIKHDNPVLKEDSLINPKGKLAK